MNVRTGELFRMDPEMEKELAERFFQENEDFQPVPDEFNEEVEKELNGNDRCFVDITKETPLTKWAKAQKKAKSKAKRKLVKKSRRMNRG